jgi:UDP-N-acetylmuramate dehydrogenase
MITQNEVELAPLLWYKIGGKAQYLFDCKSKKDILQALEVIKLNNVSKVFVVGLGSNLIFTDDYYDGAIIRIANDPTISSVRLTPEGLVESFAGDLLDTVIQFSLNHELVGLEWGGGLPGTLGAAVRGNVGAFGGEIKDNLVSVDILDYEGERPELKTMSKAELEFSYRESWIKTHEKKIVITARFNLKKGTPEEVTAAKEVYQKNIQFRKDRHPLEYPNCGSVFKNIRDKQQVEKVLTICPELTESVEKKWYGKVAVASLIEKLGLKGYRIGDAQVSEKHALFIVNVGHASARDVKQVISDIQGKFKEKFGFQLETEVEIVQ